MYSTLHATKTLCGASFSPDPSKSGSVQFSYHATIRTQQRSIPAKVVKLILAHGHPEKKEGDAVEIKIRKKDLARLISDHKHEIRLLEKAGKKAVLVSGKEDTVITVYTPNNI